jgi:excisionase family DNA binding protein
MSPLSTDETARSRQKEVVAADQLLTLRETAEILKVKEFRAAELVRLRILPAVHLGRQVRVSRKTLLSFIEQGGKGL